MFTSWNFTQTSLTSAFTDDGFFCQGSVCVSQQHQCSPRTWGISPHSFIVPIDTLSNLALSSYSEPPLLSLLSPHNMGLSQFMSVCSHPDLPTAAMKYGRPSHITLRLRTCFNCYLSLGSDRIRTESHPFLCLMLDPHRLHQPVYNTTRSAWHAALPLVSARITYSSLGHLLPPV